MRRSPLRPAALAAVVLPLSLVWLSACCGAAEPGAKPSAQPQPVTAQSLVGVWQGTLKVQTIELRLVLHVSSDGGGLKATLDSLDQGAKSIPIDRVALEGNTLILELKKVGASFEGKVAEDRQTVDGKWTQSGSLPLEFKRLEKEPDFARPQEPKKPYPYVETEVTYENEARHVRLAGTLTHPAADRPAPAVLLISGSGPQDRDESVAGHKPFLVLADYLTRRGIVVLRVDDRGVGGSSGDTLASTTADVASDALAGVAFLKSRPEVDPKQIGLLGHSEGGLVAPLAAGSSDDVAFIVMLAGSGVTGEEIIYHQGELIDRAQGADDAAVASARRMRERTVLAIKESADPVETERRVRQIIAEDKDAAGDKKDATGQAFEAQLKFGLSPWFRYFLSYDPRPALRRVKCPVLALNGEKDLQVDPRQNLPAIEAALKDSGNDDFEVRELKGLNHLFQRCQTGSPSEYSKIDETIAPEVLQLIGDWILQRTGSSAGK